MHCTRKMLKGDISAAREENAIQAGVERVPSVFSDKRWDQHRNTSRLQDGIGIGFMQNDTRLAVFIRLIMCSNSDERFHGDIVNQKDPKGFESFRVLSKSTC